MASNLAMALAKKYRAVMLIDADLRNPTQIRLLGRKAMGKEGLDRLLQGTDLSENRVMQAAAYDEETNLVTLISETPCRNAAKLLASPNMAELLSVVRKTMDLSLIHIFPRRTAEVPQRASRQGANRCRQWECPRPAQSRTSGSCSAPDRQSGPDLPYPG